MLASDGPIETDYLVVGAGASGVAFVDELVHHGDAHVVLVDRRHQPGGHWNDAYPFVRLHQPSAYYGVNSRPLGFDRIDVGGSNAGMYERASGAEICDYYRRVLDEHLLPTGRVRFLGETSYVGSLTDAATTAAPAGPGAEPPTEKRVHRLRSNLDGEITTVRARRRMVDATYVESVVPETHRPSFEIDTAARVVTPRRLVDLDAPASGFTVIGAGKTAMDVCCWLLDQRVDPDAIRWIRPRDGWLVDRRGAQPFELVAGMAEYQADMVEAAATATSGLDLALRLEESGDFHRLDRAVAPEVYRGATISTGELEQLRSIEQVVRMGRVRAIGERTIELADGRLPTSSDHVHIDCTAQGLATATPRPIFSAGRITVQFTTLGVAPWSAAILGFVESLDVDDDERNRLGAVVPRTGLIADQLAIMHAGFRAEGARRTDGRVAQWAASARLNPGRSMADHLDDERVGAAMNRMMTHLDAAVANLSRHA